MNDSQQTKPEPGSQPPAKEEVTLKKGLIQGGDDYPKDSKIMVTKRQRKWLADRDIV